MTSWTLLSYRNNIFVKYQLYGILKYRHTGLAKSGPAAPVLAGPVFSQSKNKIPFLQIARNKQSASVIFGLIRLIILS